MVGLYGAQRENYKINATVMFSGTIRRFGGTVEHGLTDHGLTDNTGPDDFSISLMHFSTVKPTI